MRKFTFIGTIVDKFMICRRRSETTPFNSDQDFFFGGGVLDRRQPHRLLLLALVIVFELTKGALQFEQLLVTGAAAVVLADEPTKACVNAGKKLENCNEEDCCGWDDALRSISPAACYNLERDICVGKVLFMWSR